MADTNYIQATTESAESPKSAESMLASLPGKLVNHGRVVVAGVLTGFAMTVSSPGFAQTTPTNNEVSASMSAFTPNPEYDGLIAEAEKAGKDPVDYALEKGKNEDFASKLDGYISKKVVIAKKQEGEQLDKVVIASQMRLESTTNQLITKYWELLRIFDTLMPQNKLTTTEGEKIVGIYRDPSIPPEMKKYIEDKFGKFLRKSALTQV